MILLSFFPAVAVAVIQAEAQPKLRVEGTEFVLERASGKILRSVDLVGGVITFGERGNSTEVIINSVDPGVGFKGGNLFLHSFSVTDKTGTTSFLCLPDAAGKSLGFPIDDGRGGIEIACTSGAVGKCVLWGYRPWKEAEDGSTLRQLHQACVYMVRADYGADGSSSTRDGTLIAFCDRHGIHPCDNDLPFSFEAAWGVNGAKCVARTRISELGTSRQLVKRYPDLSGHVGPVACNDRTAFEFPGTLLINHSPRRNPPGSPE